MALNFKSTDTLTVPEKIIDQVIGQDAACEIVKKAAKQRRHVLLIGEPGTGKSMLGLALAELLPKEKLVDTLAFYNPNDENQPLIRTMPASKGRELVAKARVQNMGFFRLQNIILLALLIASLITPWWARSYYGKDNPTTGAIMFTAFFLGGMLFLAAYVIFMSMGRRALASKMEIPKIIVDNYGRKQAPFWDATGAHAGALLGDVLHDPLQSFLSSDIFVVCRGKINHLSFQSALDRCAPRLFKAQKNGKNYEAAFTLNDEFVTLGEKNGKITPAEILSFNQYDYEGKMIQIVTTDNKHITVTPEHKIAISKQGKLDYIEAQNIKKGMEVFSLKEEIIIDEQDIIETYDKKQQKQCQLYYSYLQLKEQNPSLGYKKIARMLGQSYGKTRWWHAQKHTPIPVQTCNWLKQKGLLPLTINNQKLPLLAKILGTTFGDGGIFDNLNGIFLSSSELSAVQEFSKDFKMLFNTENDRVIQAGEYGHSWCYQNTNRNIIRLFLALGAPKGNKTKSNLFVPSWIKLNPAWEKEFWGSFLGNELGVPKVHISGRNLDSLAIGICANNALEQNRMDFLAELKHYFEKNQIDTGKLTKTRNKQSENFIFKLLISTTFENVVNFSTLIKINYCTYKQQKLISTLEKFSELKRKKYEELLRRGYGAEHSMKLLQLTPAALYIILNQESFQAHL